MPGLLGIFSTGLSGVAIASVLSSVLSSVAFAQTAPGGGPQQAPAWMQMFPLIVLFVVFYFFMIRPQAKRQKQHQQFLAALKRGDQVITGSGILGRVEGITDAVVTLEISDGVRVKMLKNQIAGAANLEGRA